MNLPKKIFKQLKNQEKQKVVFKKIQRGFSALLKTKKRRWWALGTLFLVLLGLFLSLRFSLAKKDGLSLKNTSIFNEYLYQSKSKGFAVYLGSRQEKDLAQAKFTAAKASVDFKPLDWKQGEVKIVKDQNSVTYQEISPGIDLTYTLTEKGLKEEVIIKTEAARRRVIQRGRLLFEANIDQALLQQEKRSDGVFQFADLKNQKSIFYIPKPFMIDAQGKRSEKVEIDFTPQKENQNKFTVSLTPDRRWLTQASLPIIIDPSVELSILNVHSHPKTGDNWEVSFQTQGTDDLTITPMDQATIDDMDFVSLTCDGQEKTPQILANDILFYPDWNCPGTAKVIHFVRLGGTHNLEFRFGDQTALAHNSPATEILRPVSEGDSAQNDPEGSCASNYECVDEEEADGTTSYIRSQGGSGSFLDLYNIEESAVGSGPITKITVHGRIYPQTPEKYARLAIKPGETVYYSSIFYEEEDTWTDISYEWTENPETETEWSWADIDELQIGVELTNADLRIYCTQIYLEIDYSTDYPPEAPTDLLTEGLSNPQDVLDETPEFSAVFNDLDVGDTATAYRIQVDNNSDFSSVLWDSGSSGTAMSDCDEGERCEDISYAGLTLERGITYHWRIKFWDADNDEGQWSTESASFALASIPTAPTELLTDGQSNPTDVKGTNPKFSAVFNDTSGDIADKYWIRVDDDTSFGSPVWDSGSSGTSMNNCTASNRCAEISYAGSALSEGTTYYWQIKFWDDGGNEGDWSNTGVLNTGLDFEPADESSFSQENLAYNTSLTPSATEGNITLTLGSGNWNTNTKIKAGCRVVGNSGVATLINETTASSTINASVDTEFTDTDAITSGNWQLYCTGFDDLEKLVLNDFSTRSEFNDIGYGTLSENAEAVKIDTDKILIAYSPPKGIKAVIATISGNNISYGDEFIVLSSIYSYKAHLALLDTNKAIVVYGSYDEGNKAMVISVSGTNIDSGEEFTFMEKQEEYESDYIDVVQLSTNKALIAYEKGNTGAAIVASAEGSNISYGTESIFSDYWTYDISLSRLNTDKALIAYENYYDDVAEAVVASVTGNSISLGSKATFDSFTEDEYISDISTVELDTDKVLIGYYDNEDGYGKAVVASVSDTTISYGSIANFNEDRAWGISASQLNTNKVLISYYDWENELGKAIVASVSDTTISYGSSNDFADSGILSFTFTSQIATDKVLITFGKLHNLEGPPSGGYGYNIISNVSDTTISYGSEYQLNSSAEIGITSIAKIDTNKVLIAYHDGADNGYGTAIVATVSGGAITYGDEEIFNSEYTNSISALKLDTDKALIAFYPATDGNAKAVVASISGSDISYGSESTFKIPAGGPFGGVQVTGTQIATDKALLVYADFGSMDAYGNAIVASVSDTTISYGSETNFSANGNIYEFSASQLSTDKALIAYVDFTDGLSLSVVASISGTAISYGDEEVFYNDYSYNISTAPLDTDKIIIAYQSYSSTPPEAIVASVSGTTISYGDAEVFNENDIYRASLTQIDTNKAIITYWDLENDSGKALIASVSGTTISYGEETTFDSNLYYISQAQLDTDKVLITYNLLKASEAKYYGTGIVADIDGSDITFGGYPENTYYSTTTSDTNQINVGGWTDINSITAVETLNSQTIHYGVSFDDRTTWKIYDSTEGDTGWRPIARDNSGTWEYNSNATPGATDITWTSATINTQFGALDQAFQVTANQQTGTELNAVADAQWEVSGGFDPGATVTLDFAFGLKTTSETDTPKLDQITINYDGDHDYFMITTNSPTGCMIDDSGQPDQIIVKWTDNSGSETGYRIERSVNGGEWTLLSTEEANITSKTDDTTEANNTYQYRIQANSQETDSQWCTTPIVNYGRGTFYFQ